MAIDEDQLDQRKCVASDVKADGERTGLIARCVTSSFVLPMRIITLFSAQPFHISACQMHLELTSFVGEARGRADDDIGIPRDSARIDA